MQPSSSELRIPATPAFIVVAKRAAAGFAAVAGFDVEALDHLVIAVAQACQHAIACCQRSSPAGQGQLRLTFTLEGQGIEVQVRSLVGPASETSEVDRARLLEARRAQAEAEAATDLALRVMGVFVDKYRYTLDERTGGLRVRLTKYRGS